MVSKNLAKFIRSLELKKNRVREQAFVAEGPKVVADLLEVFSPIHLIATQAWLSANPAIAANTNITETTDDELQRVSLLQHPQQVLAVLRIPAHESMEPPQWSEGMLTLALDNIQDPGNMGTIIRIADWFGIEQIVCNTSTVDAYNPKVVQATMGSLARVRVSYTNLSKWLENLSSSTPVYGTFLDGENLYNASIDKQRGGIIVMGNEGNGISPEVGASIDKRLLIPNYPPNRPTVDSLNVAIATAIICAEFRRG